MICDLSVARASGCLPPAADSAGLTVDATVSISTALLPTAGSRRFVELSTPLVWDGSQHLLLEFSMEGGFLPCCVCCGANTGRSLS